MGNPYWWFEIGSGCYWCTHPLVIVSIVPPWAPPDVRSQHRGLCYHTSRCPSRWKHIYLCFFSTKLQVLEERDWVLFRFGSHAQIWSLTHSRPLVVIYWRINEWMGESGEDVPLTSLLWLCEPILFLSMMILWSTARSSLVWILYTHDNFFCY